MFLKKITLFKEFKKDRWVKPFFKKYKFSLSLALFLGFLTFFCGGALMFNSGYLISKSASKPENILLVYIPIVLTRAFGIGRPAFKYLERLVSHNWVLKMTSNLRLKLYQSLEKDAIFLKRDYRLGDILGLLAEDINHIQNLYLRTIFPTVIGWAIYLFIVVSIGFFSLSFALVIFIYMSIFLLIYPLVSILISGKKQVEEKKLKNDLYTNLTDNIMGISDWIFSQRTKEYLNLHKENQARLSKIKEKLFKIENWRNLLFQITFGGLILLFIFWAGNNFHGVKGGEANWIAAFSLALFPLVDAFINLPAASQEANVYVDSLKRLNKLKIPFEQTKEVFLPKKPYDIEINQAVFKYEDSKNPILKGIDLKVKQGKKVAILGRSGSGKTTLAGLLRGDLKLTAGQITLGNVDVSKIGSDISNYIGIIQQKPYLFQTTILNNIRLGKNDATEKQIWDVLKRVGLKELVKSLPKGLNTMVDSAGLRFSGGERHRLALARNLLQDTPIIILDEPTVGLDPITESALIKMFIEQLAGKTLIWITHHLKGIEFVDQVVFIEDGKIEIKGSPRKLAESSKRYQKLKKIDDGDSC